MLILEYKCDTCNQLFKNAYNLNKHKLTHIDLSERKVFICEYEDCHRIYLHRRNLTHHVQVIHEGVQKGSAVICDYPGCGVHLKNKVILLGCKLS